MIGSLFECYSVLSFLCPLALKRMSTCIQVLLSASVGMWRHTGSGNPGSLWCLIDTRADNESSRVECFWAIISPTVLFDQVLHDTVLWAPSARRPLPFTQCLSSARSNPKVPSGNMAASKNNCMNTRYGGTSLIYRLSTTAKTECRWQTDRQTDEQHSTMTLVMRRAGDDCARLAISSPSTAPCSTGSVAVLSEYHACATFQHVHCIQTPSFDATPTYRLCILLRCCFIYSIGTNIIYWEAV